MTRTWSNEQAEIFDWFSEGAPWNLIVRARAGTGKTTTILHGVSLAREPKILLAAFNKSIAKELQSRIARSNVEAKTLHGLGFQYIRRRSRVTMDDANPWKRASLLVERVEANAPIPMHRMIRDLHTKARDIDPWIAQEDSHDRLYQMAVRFELLPDDDWEDRGWTAERVCKAAHRAMKLAMERTELIDFADMIFLPLIHEWVTPSYDLVVVDEAQDMTVAQLTLAVGSCRQANGGRMCVIGDDRQAIYSFRGADSGSLDRLKEGLDASELGLTTTYRCPKLVVALAAEIVPDYRAADSAPDGEIVTINTDRLLLDVAEGDFVLSRTNAPLVRICMALLREGKRARIKGRDIGKGVMALIRKLGASDVEDIGPLLDVWLAREYAKARKMPEEAAAERVEFVLDQAGIVRVLIEDAESMSVVEQRCADLFSDDERPSIMCSTVHRAKGLEADNVFLLRKTFRDGTIEEMNLRYVAVTRTKRKLAWVEGDS